MREDLKLLLTSSATSCSLASLWQSTGWVSNRHSPHATCSQVLHQKESLMPWEGHTTSGALSPLCSF